MAATPSAPNPRGVALDISAFDEPAVDAAGQFAFAIAACVAFALIIWEYITLLPHELRLYRKPLWGTPTPYAFLALRYGGILVTFPTLFLSVFKTDACQAAASVSQAGIVLIMAASTLIFTLRTSLLWADNRIVRGSLSGLAFFVSASWIALATQYRATTATIPSTGLGFASQCRIHPTVSWLPLGYASAGLFFLTALILYLLKMRFYDPRDSLVAYQIYRANAVYLFGSAATSVAALVLQLPSLSQPASTLALCTASLAPVLITAFGTRGFQNLMLARVLHADGHGRSNTSLPYPSASPIISHASEARYAYAPPQPQPPSPPLTPRPSRSTLKYKTSSPQISAEKRPHTASSTTPLDPRDNPKLAPVPPRPTQNPYTTFPSPPASYNAPSALSAGGAAPGSSYTARSVLTSSSSESPNYANSGLSGSPSSGGSLSPLRRGMVGARQHMPEALKSGWSDS